MNRALQPETHPGRHPDAESLNAFIEQALPAPERAQILGHIASCSRCRQVVFLAQQAAAEAPLAVPAMRPTSRVPWYQNWQLIWAPAAAFALIAGLAVLIHMRHPAVESELARNAPVGQVAPPASSLEQTQAPESRREAAPSPPVIAAKKSAISAEAGEPAGAALSPPGSSGAISADSVSASPASAESPTVAMAPGAAGKNTVVLQPHPRPQSEAAAWQQERQSAAGALASAARTTQATFKARIEQNQAQASQAVAAAPTVQTTPASDGGFAPSASRPMAGGGALFSPQTAKLPSGLAAISSATAQRRRLALDAAGALFVSEDAGTTWKSVAQQWTGHAVLVRVQPAPAGNAAVQPNANASAGAFELVTESNLVWLSVDGKNWKAQ
jgi:hypothetical protein